MELSEIKNRLDNLSTEKLVDITKNYKQYGYNNEILDYVLFALETRGFNKLDLRLTGNLGNSNYEHAKQVFLLYKGNSNKALIFYLVSVITKFLPRFITGFSEISANIFFISSIVFGLLFLYFLLKSFFNQSELYKLTGENFGLNGALLYVLGGISFYFILYFHFLNQMKSKINEIR